jgi:hypothetical protein
VTSAPDNRNRAVWPIHLHSPLGIITPQILASSIPSMG